MPYSEDKRKEMNSLASKRYRAKKLAENPDYFKEYFKSRKERLPEENKLNKKKWRENNPEYRQVRLHTFESRTKRLFNGVKSNARKRGLEFDLNYEDVVWNTICPLLEVPINYEKESYQSDYSPSIDRRDNTKGYTKDNIWVVSRRANFIKRDATPKELMLIAKNLL